jgi:hypothetical protein
VSDPIDEGSAARAAAALVTGDRKGAYGPVEKNFQHTADLWSSYLNHKITPIDVAILMVLLKISRVSDGAYKADNFVDMCGYDSLAGFLADKK